MEMDHLLPLIARWVHIGSAMAAIGAPFFVRFALLPSATQVLDDATHQKLRESSPDFTRFLSSHRGNTCPKQIKNYTICCLVSRF
jgi:hypothetical protein